MEPGIPHNNIEIFTVEVYLPSAARSRCLLCQFKGRWLPSGRLDYGRQFWILYQVTHKKDRVIFDSDHIRASCMDMDINDSTKEQLIAHSFNRTVNIWRSAYNYANISSCWLIEAERRLCASPNLATIISDNGLSPFPQQTIIWTIAG